MRNHDLFVHHSYCGVNTDHRAYVLLCARQSPRSPPLSLLAAQPILPYHRRHPRRVLTSRGGASRLRMESSITMAGVTLGIKLYAQCHPQSLPPASCRVSPGLSQPSSVVDSFAVGRAKCPAVGARACSATSASACLIAASAQSTTGTGIWPLTFRARPASGLQRARPRLHQGP